VADRRLISPVLLEFLEPIVLWGKAIFLVSSMFLSVADYELM